MAEILDKPLPENFYQRDGWVDSIVSFYGEQQKMLPAEQLQKPAEVLANAIYDATEIYGNFPDIPYKALGQTIDPLFESREYYDKVYMLLKNSAIEEKNDLLQRYADGLLTIRQFFERNKETLQQKFPDEISQTEGENYDAKLEKFANVLYDVTRAHVQQIRDMIAWRKE